MATKKKALQAAAGAAGGAGPLVIEDVFSTYLYTGNGTTQTITNGIDLAGEGGLVWSKSRSGAYSHGLYDTERGATKEIKSDATTAESTDNGVTAFNSDGYDVGARFTTNNSGDTYASWTFRKAPRFFDVVTISAPSAAYAPDVISINHNLNVIPGMVIIKDTSNPSNWWVWHNSFTANEYLRLQTTNANTDFGVDWINVNDTTLNLHGWFAGNSNTSGNLVAYLFAHDPLGPSGDGSDGLISCGSFTTNADGSLDLVDLGWEPQWLLIKNTSTTGSWFLYDTMRGLSESETAYLSADTSNAEATSGGLLNVKPNGFSAKAGWGGASITKAYIAIRRGPMRVPESGTEVFNIDTWGGTSPTPPTFVSGFPVDFSFYKNVTDGANNWSSQNRLTGYGDLAFNATSAEFSNNGTLWQKDYNNGIGSNTSVISTGHMWMFRRAPNFFDVVAYKGDNTTPRSIPHNLGVAPELMIVKVRDFTRGWNVYHKDLTASGGQEPFMELNLTDAVNHDSSRYPSAPTASDFIVGNNEEVNSGNYNYIAYLFASLDGVSKVGSYDGDGTANRVIDCGFTSGARFVMIKAYNTAGNWLVFDTVRGIVAGADPFLQLNNTAAENSSFDIVEPAASGFAVTQDASVATNETGQSYIFLAIA